MDKAIKQYMSDLGKKSAESRKKTKDADYWKKLSAAGVKARKKKSEVK